MLKLGSIVILSCFIFSSCLQDENLKQDKIIYELSKDVNDSICKYINKRKIDVKYCEIIDIDNGYTLNFLYEVNVENKKYISKTNRFIRVNDSLIPVTIHFDEFDIGKNIVSDTLYRIILPKSLVVNLTINGEFDFIYYAPDEMYKIYKYNPPVEPNITE